LFHHHTQGKDLNFILHNVKVPAHLTSLPYLRPHYDETEFIVRNIWRLYGGWWDLDPANLKPAPKASLAREIAELSGGYVAIAQQ
jgi:alkyl sulfatase BDS1-like metallo-beta-lactamase superfamily hydrolase